MRLNDYTIYSKPLEELIVELVSYLKKASSGEFKILACMNPHSYYMADFDSNYKVALLGSDWLIPDGVGIIAASRLLKDKVHSKISGFDIFEQLSAKINSVGGVKVFFLGSSIDTLEKIISKYERQYPNIEVVGSFSPPFEKDMSEETNQISIEKINGSKADIVWVGLSAPKQEKWMLRNKNTLNSKLAFGIGAVFDFYSGNIVRSSPIFRDNGLEWLPRLIQEPRRLWRRTFISAPYFVLSICRYTIRNVFRKNENDV